jgi:hypothetical protein
LIAPDIGADTSTDLAAYAARARQRTAECIALSDRLAVIMRRVGDPGT